MNNSVMLLSGFVTVPTDALHDAARRQGGFLRGAGTAPAFRRHFLLENRMTAEQLKDGLGDLYEVEPITGCWLWTKGAFSNGYGNVWMDHKPCRAHRMMWTVHNGPIPAGLCVLHKCDTPLCVNPDHLWLGTRSENAADCRQKGRATVVDRGASHASAKLNDHDVRQIRRLLKEGEVQEDIAKQFGVARETVSTIKGNRSWAWLS